MELVRYPGAGCVVEFMQGNAPQIAWILDQQHEKFRLLLPNRREMLLTANRILPWAGPTYPSTSKDAAISILEKHKKNREQAEAGFNPLELWELAQGEVSKASAEWFAGLAFNEPDIDVIAACGHILLTCKSHFRFQSPEFEIFSEEVVAARLAEQEANRRRDALANEGATLFRQLWDLHLQKRSDPIKTNLDTEILDHLRHMLLTRIADPETAEESSLWQGLTKGLPEDDFLALHLARAWNLVGPHHNFWLDRIGYAAGNEWSETYQEEIQTILNQAAETENSPAECDLPFISIDSATTKDIDDSFFLEPRPEGGWHLVLALANPAAYWTFESELDLAVRRRASSLYLPEGTCHMLPENLGTGACSLLQGKTRQAFLVSCDIDPDGKVLSCQPSSSTVRLAANLAYTDCEAVLEDKADSDNPALPFAEMLRQADLLAETCLNQRVKNGAVIIERPELLILLEGEGEDIKVRLEEEESIPRTHNLVSEMMILVNAALAEWASEKGISLLYRTQDVSIPPGYAGVWRDPVEIARVVKVLAPALLEMTPRPHAGLGEKAYAPSSSPLRRYADLVNEEQMLHFLHTGSPHWTNAELSSLLTFLKIRSDMAAQVQRSWPRYWKLLYFLQQGDVWWQAVVTDENDFFVTVTLPKEQLLVRAKRNLYSERTYCGEDVSIRLTRIRPLYNDFQLAEVRENA